MREVVKSVIYSARAPDEITGMQATDASVPARIWDISSASAAAID
jgi:hypothetical protein